MEELLELLHEIKPEVDFEKESDLIEDELIDSFDIIEISTEISARFGVNITVKDATPENFCSAKAMYEMIQGLQGR